MQDPVDRTQFKRWWPPGTVTVLSRNENQRSCIDLRADHFLTPESEDTHHYYVALARNFRVADHSLSKQLDSDTRQVHMEDVAITEAQREMAEWTPGRHDMGLKADRAVREAHAILKRLADEEVEAFGR
jgi:hypothetical protein